MSVAQNFGLPVTLLVIMFWALFRVARWMAPKIEAIFAAHLSLVENLQKQVRIQTELSATQTELSTKTLVVLTDIRQTLDIK